MKRIIEEATLVLASEDLQEVLKLLKCKTKDNRHPNS